MFKSMVVALVLAASVNGASAQMSQRLPLVADQYFIDGEAEKMERGIVTDTIFIHHTEWRPNVSWRFLSVEQRKRLYDCRFKHFGRGSLFKSHSGHFRHVHGKDIEVFYAYHWIVRKNGKIERLLNDGEVGWHAGNWEENLRSVAIVFDGDYRKKAPPKKALRAAARLIRQYMAQNPGITRLKAHHDVYGAECPGAWFYTKDKHGQTGRDRLLALAGVQLSDK